MSVNVENAVREWTATYISKVDGEYGILTIFRVETQSMARITVLALAALLSVMMTAAVAEHPILACKQEHVRGSVAGEIRMTKRASTSELI